jgi:hypothetical protein
MDVNDISQRYSVTSFDKADKIIKSKEIIEETATIKGKTRTVHRLYATNASGFSGVGWIVDDDIDSCMICNREFGFFLRKHHCRCCGNLVCYICSPEFVVIFEMQEMGDQRVCIQCYWGQDPLFAVHTRQYNESDDDDEEESDQLHALRKHNKLIYIIFKIACYCSSTCCTISTKVHTNQFSIYQTCLYSQLEY